MIVTLQQLQNKGFTLVAGVSAPSDRVQLWTGAAADGSAVMVWWDSVSGRVFQAIDNNQGPLLVLKGLVTLAAILNDVIVAIPVNVIDAPAKLALRTAILAGITDINI